MDLTVHVVGFGIKKDEVKGLKCLADATGGTYFAAGDAKELSRALEQAVANKPAEQPDGEATLFAPDTVRAGSRFAVSWQGPNQLGDEVVLAEPTADGRTWLGNGAFAQHGKGELEAATVRSSTRRWRWASTRCATC